MRVIVTILAFTLHSFIIFGQSANESYWVNLPRPKGAINDFENNFSINQKKKLDSLIKIVKESASIDINIVTIPLGATEKEKFIELSKYIIQQWGIGRRNKAILIAISKGHQTISIKNGLSDENVLSSDIAKHIIDDVFIPAVKAGSIYKGTLVMVEELSSIFKPAPMLTPEPKLTQSENNVTESANPASYTYNYLEAKNISEDYPCPMSGGGSERTVIYPVGWSKQGCFYYLEESTGAPIGRETPMLKKVCPETNFTADLSVWSPNYEEEGVFDYNIFLKDTLHPFLQELIKQEGISNSADWTLLKSMDLPVEYGYVLNMTEESDHDKSYYVKKEDGTQVSIKHYHETEKVESDQSVQILGGGEYIGYIKTPFEGVVLLVFSLVDYRVGFEHANVCSYEYYILK